MSQFLSELIRKGMQRKIAALIFMTLISLLYAGGSLAFGAEKGFYRIGISKKAFGNVNDNDASAALKAWATMITKEQNLDAKVEAVLLKGSMEEIRKSYIDYEFDGFGLITPELFEMDIKPEYVYIGKRGTGINLNYVIITHAQGSAASPRDMVGRKLISCDSNQMALSFHWLENIMFSEGLKTGRPKIVENLSNAILQVYFRQADAAMVTREAFELACELNPQLKKELIVLSESPPLIPVIFILQSSTGQEKRMAVLEKIVLDIDKTTGGRQVLTVIQSSSFEKYPLSILDSTFELLRERNSLIKESEVQ